MNNEKKQQRDANWMWHVWMNRQNKIGDDNWDHSMYEFKNMLEFLEYGHISIREAFEGNLRKVHQQCSRQAPVEIKENSLRCCSENVDVTKCPLLLSLKAVFEEEKLHHPVPDGLLYRTMAKTCAWHIHKVACGIPNKHWGCDTSEGYLKDESDRMFWSNIYESMASSCDPDDEPATQDDSSGVGTRTATDTETNCANPNVRGESE